MSYLDTMIIVGIFFGIPTLIAGVGTALGWRWIERFDHWVHTRR